jgi:hypothetical protein
MSMTVGEKGKLTEMELDRRVRERLLASGALDTATIEAYLANLSDLEEQAESMPIEQPALGAGSRASRIEAELDDEGSE